MKRSIPFLLLWLLIFPVIAGAQTTPTPGISTTPPIQFTTTTDPVSLIGAYFNAISMGDYARAYRYWETPPQGRSEQAFADGYADTAAVSVIVRLPVFEDAGAGNFHAALPVLVTGVQDDGSTEYYAGCFTAHKTNVPVGDAPEPDPNWYLQAGELTQQATPDTAALASICGENSATLADNPNPASALSPLGVVEAYFSAVAQGASGADAWQEDTEDSFNADYGIAAAAADGIDLLVNPAIFSDGAAGSIHASVPALIVFRDLSGGTELVTGCINTRLVNVPQGAASEPDPNWHLVESTFETAPDITDAIRVLSKSCLAE